MKNLIYISLFFAAFSACKNQSTKTLKANLIACYNHSNSLGDKIRWGNKTMIGFVIQIKNESDREIQRENFDLNLCYKFNKEDKCQLVSLSRDLRKGQIDTFDCIIHLEKTIDNLEYKRFASQEYHLISRIKTNLINKVEIHEKLVVEKVYDFEVNPRVAIKEIKLREKE